MSFTDILRFTINFYKKLYFILAISVFVYVLVGFSTAAIDFQSGHTSAGKENLVYGTILLFNGFKFFTWYFIFKLFAKLFVISNPDTNFIFRSLSLSFLVSFGVDLASFLFITTFGVKPKVDWTMVNFPSLDHGSFHFVANLFLWIFKVMQLASDFLMPTLTGISALVAPLACLTFIEENRRL